MGRLGALLTLLSIVLAGVMAVAPPAGATVPERHTFADQGSFVDESTCGFPITFAFQQRGTDTVYFDTNGNPVRERIFNHISSLDSANGITLRESDSWSDTIYIRRGVETVTGLLFHVNAAGQGHVLLDVGRIVTDANGNIVFEAGIHQFQSGDLGAFCAALS